MKIQFLCEKPLDELLFDILNEKKHYVPEINMSGSNLQNIKFQIGKYLCSIS